MTPRPLAAAAAALALAACATTTGGTAPLPIPDHLAARSHVGSIRMTSGWLRAEPDFPETFTEEVSAALADCARGPEPLDLRLHVAKVRRESRLDALIDGGAHELRAIAEFVDPRTREVVGRYPIHVRVDAGGPVEALLADRQAMVSAAFATELCRQAFGRG